MAITGFVLGILSVLCMPLVGVLGVVFGLLGLREIRRGGGAVGGRGLSIAGVVLGSIGTLVTAAAVGLVVYAGSQGAPRPAMADLPVYESLTGEGLSGSGFHFDWQGKRYIACSLHQFDGEVPEKMHGAMMEPVSILGLAHRQDDIQILTYDEAKLEGVEPLVYQDRVGVRRGERVRVMGYDGPVDGTVVLGRPLAQGLVFLELDKPIKLRGLSGSPVISGVTGTVIGVLLTGDEEAGIVGFELLDLPRVLRGSEGP